MPSRSRQLILFSLGVKHRIASIWFWIQLGIVLLFAGGGLVLPKRADSNPPWFLLAFAFLYGVLSTPWQLRWGQRRDPLADWSARSWFRRPFDGPLQAFFLGSRAFIAFGIVGCLRAAFSDADGFFAGFALTCGLGIYIGLWWFLHIGARSHRAKHLTKRWS